MALTLLRPGPLATLQGAPRSGQRHQGIPASGPADPLSMALANRLVGNASTATAIEFTLGGAEVEFHQDTVFAFTGAASEARLSGAPVAAHQIHPARRGDRLAFPHPPAGARTYLAIASGFQAEEIFASTSTFMAAGFGGHNGRALRAGDVLMAIQPGGAAAPALTPTHLRPRIARAHSLRAVAGPDYAALGDFPWRAAFEATRRMDRTGLELSGPWLVPEGGAQRPSSALFTGAVQLTPAASAFLLLPDAQTTGGYPHVLQVIRADRHLLGQIAPGDRISFLKRSVDEAYQDLKSKTALFAGWLPDFRF